jgi:formylmethanofuran dehydrogenase subunit E
MHEHASARKAVETMIRSGDLEGLLRTAELLHGHRCPMLALGVKAGHYAMNRLNREGAARPEVVALVEGLSCFVDGIQTVTGCTLGNGGLMVKDLGKTAAVVARRRDGAAVRLLVRPDFRERMFARYPAAGPLFEKVMVQGEGSDEDRHRFTHLWEAMARRELDVPLEEQLQVQPLTVSLPPPGRSFQMVTCSRCGEGAAESRTRVKAGQPLCLACAGEEYYLLSSQGISRVKGP